VLVHKDNPEISRTFIHPGGMAVATGETVLSTLLGSCVAACLYDPVNSVIGMNHYLMTARKYLPNSQSRHNEPGRYGEQAMQLLIEQMLQRGAKKENLQAKAFGGANVLHSLCKINAFSQVGENNCLFVREFLKLENIPLVASRLGGSEGMMVHFSSTDFSVHVKPIKQSQGCDFVKQNPQLQVTCR
jgi:chemotaxis protein CheD